VIEARDVRHIYDVPEAYHEQGLDKEVLAHFRIDNAPEPDLSGWQKIATTIHNPDGEVCIGLVGKYTDVPDAYKSVAEALSHGGLANNVKVSVKLINSEEFDDEHRPLDILEGVHGIILPGGFGERGAHGKMRAARFARERKVPCFGICYGMQMSVIEAARHMAGIEDANTTENNPSTPNPLVGLMEEWTQGNEKQVRTADSDKGGTMRLGAYPARPEGRQQGRGNLRHSRHLGTPPPPVRGQRGLYRGRLKKLVDYSPACRPTARCLKSSRSRRTHGSSAFSTTRS
jgi:CTP synthase